MRERGGRCHHDRVSPHPRYPERPRRPAFLPPAAADAQVGSVDPAQRIEAAHATAEALVAHGRDGDDERTARLVALADEHGIDEMAHLWSDRPADTLPGALWRLYALRAGIRRDPVDIARAFEHGRHRAPVHEVVAGVGEPPGPEEVQAVADAVLAGAFTGDLGVALDRAAAFCRVVSTGWALMADTLDDPIGPGRPAALTGAGTPAGHEPSGPEAVTPAAGLTRRAADLLRTGVQLELAATRWREGGLH